MRALLALLLGSTFAVGCSSVTAVGPERTLLIEFDHLPSSADTKAVSRRGAQVTLLIQVVRGVLVRTPAEAESFKDIGGVVSVKDLGLEEDPVVSVFIHMLATPTEADVALVTQAGGVGASGDPSRLLITTHMRMSALDGLLTLAHVGDINVYPNTLHLA